jgi:hypothetical protein
MLNMKRFMIVLCVAAVVAICSAAQAEYTVNTNFTTGSGASTTWTTETFAVGSSSLKLFWPLSVGANRAGVLISNFGGVTVDDFDSWSYWGKNDLTPWAQFPAFTISIDTALGNYAGKDFDTYVCIMPAYNNIAWHKIESSSSLNYAVEQNGTTGPDFTTPTSWTAFRENFSGAVIKEIRIDAGAMMTYGNTAYVDDIVLNGELITMETPEPGTIVLLVTGALGLLAYAWRRRRS